MVLVQYNQKLRASSAISANNVRLDEGVISTLYGSGEVLFKINCPFFLTQTSS